MYNEEYKNQFSLLLKILPCLRGQRNFALKGGTAINLFYRDLPRISVDIDLTYTRIENRENTIKNMNKALEDLATLIIKRTPEIRLNKRMSRNKEHIVKLNISNNKSIVKIEPNFIFRGTLHDTLNLTTSRKIIREFDTFIDEVPLVSFEDVFAGKICAALNRQHPRDLFDVKLLLDNEGISDSLRQTVVVYLACDSRPINELLNPNHLNISSLYAREFRDMTMESASLDELTAARELLTKKLLRSLTENEKNFLISIKQGDPDYSLLPFEHLEQLPALRWKVINVRKMDKKKHTIMIKKLNSVLDA